jgi:carboxyl-terminal processing protease
LAPWDRMGTCHAAARSPVAALEAAWTAVASDYPYLAYKQIDWQGLREPYRQRAELARSGQTVGLLTELLAVLADGHVFLSTGDGEHVVPYVPPRMTQARRTFRPWLAHRYLDRTPHVTSGGRLACGLLPRNVGYLYLSAFEPSDVVAECDEALAALRQTRALVVDNRSSAGGNRAEVYRIVARFLRCPLAAPPWYTRGERRQWPVIAPAGTCRYRRPVVVLVNGLTFSAAELFADLMMRLPDVTVLGETTAGGSSGWDEDALGHHTLPSGLRLRIPTVDGRGADGTPWETVGVRPRVHVPQSEDDLDAGRDRQLERALDLLAGS